MGKKFNKKNNPEWFKKSAEIIYDNPSSKVEHLFKLYKKDKYTSRVVYMNDPIGYENFRLVLFREENGNFQFVLFRKKFGISISNKIYNSEKRLLTISYKEGKFWLIDNSGKHKSVRPLTINFINHFFPNTQIGLSESKEAEIILNILEERFTWLRFVREHKVMTNIAFNTIIKNKLFNLKKALQFQYKVPKPIATIIHDSTDRWVKDYFKYYLPYLKNVESLKPEWVKPGNSSRLGMLIDTVKMAKILDKKVNCSWSSKRLKMEHDNFTKIINDIVFTGSDRKMKTMPIFSDFEKYSNFEMIKTTKEMAFEGKKQNHCVATYVNKVETGYCGIYRVNGYTLELNLKFTSKTSKSPLLTIGQLRGYSNNMADEESLNMVKGKVKDFNLNLLSEMGIDNSSKFSLTGSNRIIDMDELVSDDFCDELPF